MAGRNSLFGPIDPAVEAGYDDPPPRKGFFTDTSVCIGCKACEVACKEWNLVPGGEDLDLLGMSFDNTGALGANSWRHVAFIEQQRPTTATGGGCGGDCGCGGGPAAETASADGGEPASGCATGPAMTDEEGALPDFRWLMSSDVCKHCTHAACLDVCPTGSLMRTEFGTVVVQPDICNGCGYCVPACPYGVIDRREVDGRVWKCTLCYDRLGEGMEPACAKACPTDSIQFGDVDELRERAQRRVEDLHEAGVSSARLYGEDPDNGVDGTGAFFLLLDEPEVYGLPPDPVVTTRDLPSMWRHAGAAALVLLAGATAAFAGRRP